MRISDWSSDVCSSDLACAAVAVTASENDWVAPPASVSMVQVTVVVVAVSAGPHAQPAGAVTTGSTAWSNTNAIAGRAVASGPPVPTSTVTGSTPGMDRGGHNVWITVDTWCRINIKNTLHYKKT